MKTNQLTIVFISFVIGLNTSCKNHIDKYKVNVDTLKTLPDNFYAYRRGRIYITDIKALNYRIWFDLDDEGNIQNVVDIQDFKTKDNGIAATMKTYNIDTAVGKLYAQRFIDLSRKFKFGHILIDKQHIIAFSYKDGLAVQYAKPLNDSIENVYLAKKDFKQLTNGWFENIEP